jgi:hypothetical protein
VWGRVQVVGLKQQLLLEQRKSFSTANPATSQQSFALCFFYFVVAIQRDTIAKSCLAHMPLA